MNNNNNNNNNNKNKNNNNKNKIIRIKILWELEPSTDHKLKALLKRYVFTYLKYLNSLRLQQHFTFSGSSFHSAGAADEKAR